MDGTILFVTFLAIILGFIWFIRSRRSESSRSSTSSPEQTGIPTRTGTNYSQYNAENQNYFNRNNYNDNSKSSNLSSGPSRDPPKDPQTDPPTISRTYLHAFRLEHQRELPPPTPTIADLNIFTHILNNSLYDSNTTTPLTNDERHFDTVAAAVDTENKTILVAFNIKERIDETNSGTSRAKVVYGENFGIKEEHATIVGEMLQYFEQYGNYKVILVTTKVKPTTPQENAVCHCEMQIISFARENGMKLLRIGISKTACDKCKEELDKAGIEYEHCEPGNPRPTHWKTPKDIKTKNFRTMYIVKPQSKTSKFKWSFHHNLPPTMKQFHYNVKRSVKLQTTFNCTVSNAALLDMYDNYDRKPWLQGKYLYQNSGTYQSDRTYRKGVFWEAGVLQVSAGASIFNVSFNFMTVSANAEINPLGVSAGVNATVINLQFNAGFVNISCGIRATTCFSAGADGIEFQFLGNGFSYGPKKIKLTTSFFEITVNPNAFVALLFIVISNIPKEGIDPKCFDDFQALVSDIKQNFCGSSPPPAPSSSPPPPPAAPALLTLTNQSFVAEQHTTVPQLHQSQTIRPVIHVNLNLDEVAEGLTRPIRNVIDGISSLFNPGPRQREHAPPARMVRLLRN